jgi:ribosomal protein L35AE/L33A
MTKAKNIEFRLSKLEKGPDKNVLAIMEIRSRAIAGSLLKQIPCQALKDR